MEEQTNIEFIGIGTKETMKLKPAIVKIVKTEVSEVGEKQVKKLICLCQHPDAEELIKISSAKTEKKGKLGVGGFWINLDEDGLINKNTTLAQFLQFLNAKNIHELT